MPFWIAAKILPGPGIKYSKFLSGHYLRKSAFICGKIFEKVLNRKSINLATKLPQSAPHFYHPTVQAPCPWALHHLVF